MSFLMICDDKNNTGKGDASMLKKYRVNLSDINDLDIFKKINNVYFDTNEDRLPQKKIDQYLDIEQKILQINAKIKIFNSPQIIGFLRNKYEQHMFFQNICKDNPVFFIPDFKIINDVTDISKLDIKYPCLIQPSIALTGDFMYFCNSNEELLENYNKILNTYYNTPWHGAKNLSQIKIGKDNPIFVREFIDSKNSLMNGYRNCIRLMVVNNEIIGIYVRINNNNHDIRSCNINCNNFELNNVDKKFYNFYIENRDWFTIFLDNIYKKTGNGSFSIDMLYKDNKIYICEIGHKWYDKTSHKYVKTDRLVEHWKDPIKLLKEKIGI
jgi:glutathione synthase/RimK-type ligase-like ATP-grasp enzyme